MQKEAGCSSKILISIYQNTPHHTPEDSNTLRFVTLRYHTDDRNMSVTVTANHTYTQNILYRIWTYCFMFLMQFFCISGHFLHKFCNLLHHLHVKVGKLFRWCTKHLPERSKCSLHTPSCGLFRKFAQEFWMALLYIGSGTIYTTVKRNWWNDGTEPPERKLRWVAQSVS